MALQGRILVWDLPTRLFHWLLASSFAITWLTAESKRWQDVHVVAGYTVLGLIVFRLLWGFAGTRHARFTSFVRGPQRVIGYLRSLFGRAPEQHVGHNPAGGWAVLALLALGTATAVTGVFTYEIGGHWMEETHEAIAQAMLALVFLHVAAVLLTGLLHRQNLVKAMITGERQGTRAEGIRGPRRMTAIALAAAVAAFWFAALEGAMPQLVQPNAPGAHRLADHHGDRDAD